jgi:hypothetical protein
MAYSLSPLLKPRFFVNATNKPLVGGKLYTYLAETTTPATTYSNDTGTENTNPIILDANGECNLYLDDDVSYRLILKDANDVTYFDKDRVSSIGGGDYKVLTFNTIADLRLKIGSEKEPVAQTSGYYVAGDGGANSFYWDGTSGAADNGGTIIKPTFVSGAGRWIALNVDSVNLRQFGAKGDGSTDDTTAINAAIATAISSVIVPAGIYVHSGLTISKRVNLLGIKGAKSGAASFPRLSLKSGSNVDSITIATTGVLYAEKIDFWGNNTGQSSASSVIALPEQSGGYVGGNAMFLNDCIIRKGYTHGIDCGKNRNGGVLHNTLIIENNEIGFKLLGTDWYSYASQFGQSGGANVYVNFGSSNDFVLCDIYFSGQNGSYGGNKSNIHIDTLVNNVSFMLCQINSAYHHGIECEPSAAAANYVFNGNQFGGNGLAAVNTYSNIKIGANKASIKGNVHWTVSQLPKYLIETNSTNRVDFDDIYTSGSYVTAVTNDETKVFNRSMRDGISLGDGGVFISRKSANDKIFKCFENTDVNEKFSIDNNGIMRWGAGGGSATDTSLFRTGANGLQTGADDCFKTGLNTTANRPNATTATIGAQFYDTTLNKPIWSDGTNWRDAAGTIV